MAGRCPPSRFTTVLGPVRHCLLAFLDDGDAGRFLRAGHSTSLALLSGYAFTSHVFRPSSAAHVQQTTALYERYGLKVTRMCLPYAFQEPLLEERKVEGEAAGQRRSILPSSLVALVMGEVDPSRSANSLFAHIAALDSVGELRSTWRHSQKAATSTSASSTASTPTPAGASSPTPPQGESSLAAYHPAPCLSAFVSSSCHTTSTSRCSLAPSLPR